MVDGGCGGLRDPADMGVGVSAPPFECCLATEDTEKKNREWTRKDTNIILN